MEIINHTPMHDKVRGILEDTCGAQVDRWLLDEATCHIVETTGYTVMREALEASVFALKRANNHFRDSVMTDTLDVVEAALSKAKGE